MHAANALNLNRLRSCSLSRWPCSLAVAIHARSHGLGLASWSTPRRGHNMQSSWNIWMRWFEVYGKWSVQTNKHTYTLLQCSHASVGLAQARPNQEHLYVKNHASHKNATCTITFARTCRFQWYQYRGFNVWLGCPQLTLLKFIVTVLSLREWPIQHLSGTLQHPRQLQWQITGVQQRVLAIPWWC